MTADLGTRIRVLRGRLRALGRLEKFSLTVFAVLLLLVAIGPTIAPHPTQTADAGAVLQAPSYTHPFGTDENGMDILSRTLAAPRTDILIAGTATLISVLLGTPIGVLVGYFEGGRRRVASFAGEGLLRLLDVVQAFPVFILALVLVAARGTSEINIVAAIAFVNVPIFLRLARSEVLSLRSQPYVEAAQAVGASDTRIAFRHILPNALPPIVVQISVTIGFAILLTAGLSFVGAGVTPPTPELGSMISIGARSLVVGQWWASVFPGIALGLMVLTFAVVGEVIGKLIQPASVVGRGRPEDLVGMGQTAPAVISAEAVVPLTGIESGGPGGEEAELMPEEEGR